MIPRMKDLLFKDIIEWLNQDLRKETWITVYKDLRLETDWFAICGILVPKNHRKEFLNHGAWSLNTTTFKPGFIHYSDIEPKYRRWGIESDYEPLIYQCFYNNIYPTSYEIIEEFRLYFNLFYDTKSKCYISVNESSDESIIIKREENEIKIRTKQLREFLSAKKMSLGLQFDYYRFSQLNLAEHSLSESDYIENNGVDFCYDISFQKSDYFDEEAKKVNSRLLAKKLIDSLSDFKPILWSDSFKSKKHCDFIIGEDLESGEIKTHTCNPDKLANFFGENPNSPQFLTPVFFKRDVLSKYYQDSRKFTVDDGALYCKGSWILKIDNNLKDTVAVYLGDIGTTLPYEEQLYWRSFNIAPQGTISKVQFKRDFLTMQSSPESIDLVFKQEFEIFKSEWQQKFSFPLFKELAKNDEHCLKTIRLPLIENISEFDTLVLNLSKVFIDYLNEKEISRRITIEDKGIQGISKLEIFLNKTSPKPKYTIKFFRQLQELRSKGSAHQKGKGYLKILKELGIDDKTYLHSFEILLHKSLEVIKELTEITECPAPNSK